MKQHSFLSTFPTLDQAWLIVALALVALRPLLTSIPPHDFWWHMATGREIVQTWAIPTVDHFSYTQAGEPFYNQGWLAQVIMYGLHSLGGIELIVLVQAGVVALAYGLLLWLSVWRSKAPRLSVAVLLLLIMPMSFDNWNVRPQSYAFPLFAAFLAILTMWRLGRANRLWLLPPLMVVWVNLHGSFVLGGALMALTFAGEGIRRLIVYIQGYFPPSAAGAPTPPKPTPTPTLSLSALFWWGVATAAAILVNPRGVGVIGYVFDLLGTSSVTNLVTEWAPPTVRSTSGAIFFSVLIVCGVVLAYARRPDTVDVLLALPLLWLALGAERNVVWFGMIILPLLATQIATLAPGKAEAQKSRAQGVPLANAMVVGMAALLLLLGLPWIKPRLGLPPELGSLVSPETPIEAVEALKADPDPPQHLYHAMSYGSYLIWAAPGQPVFADPRIELYPYEQWQDYIRLNAGIGVENLLAAYQIDGLLLSNEEQANLLAIMRNDPAWTLRYEDEYSTYLVWGDNSNPGGSSHSSR